MYIFACPLLQNHYPRRDNLVRRGILQSQLNVFASSRGLEENMNHLFIGYEIFDSAWVVLQHRLDIHSVNPSYFTDHIMQFTVLGGMV